MVVIAQLSVKQHLIFLLTARTFLTDARKVHDAQTRCFERGCSLSHARYAFLEVAFFTTL